MLKVNGDCAQLQSRGRGNECECQKPKRKVGGVKVNVKWEKVSPAPQASLQSLLSILLLQFHKSDKLHKGL
jgi:hypothetical protein